MARVTTAPALRSGTQPDRCPGVLRPHAAADGAMVRVRVPGGQTTGAGLKALSAVAHTYGSGLLQLTSRGSIQLRGLPEVLPDAVADAVAAAGFLPSLSHERVRNVVASPLTGLSGGRADLRDLIAALDTALVADRRLAELPGRFLFVLDDGRGDVSGLPLDLGYRAVDAEQGLLLVGDGRHGYPVAARDAATELIGLAGRFLDRRGSAWHVRELSQPLAGSLRPAPEPRETRCPLGVLGEHLSVAVPLGLLSPVQVQHVGDAVADGPLVITPWRGLVLPHAAAAANVLDRTGLVSDDASAWRRISACVGAPWCARGRADTQGLAARLARAGGPAKRTHLSGCERRCGAPAGPYVDLLAPSVTDVDRLLRENAVSGAAELTAAAGAPGD